MRSSSVRWESSALNPERSHMKFRTTTRREFCSAIGLGVAAGFVATRTTLASPQAPKAADRELAIGQHIYKSLKWNMVGLDGTLAEKFAVLKQIGYDGVELDSPSEIDAAEALAASEKVGLPIEGVVNSTHWTVRHSDPNPEVREQRAREHEDGNAVCRRGAGLERVIGARQGDGPAAGEPRSSLGSFDHRNPKTVAAGRAAQGTDSDRERRQRIL